MMRKTALLAVFLLAFAAATHAANFWSDGEWIPSGGPDVHYVPTPPEVVDEMLRLADVDDTDLVYDLGSGDGRIVIAAAKQRGAQGVGIDIDPIRVEQGKRNAEQAGVSDRVTFLQEDLFSADFSDATVVTLYLLPSLNLRLRPALFEQLAPGTRVVSHAFHMGSWDPDAQSTIGRHNVFFWIVPANVSGVWEWREERAEHERNLRIEIIQDYQRITALLLDDSGLRQASRATLQGDRLEMSFDQGGEGTKALLFEGSVADDVIEGAIHRSGAERTPWTATRVPQTKREIDEGR